MKMVNCAKCGRKIGFFEKKHDYEYDDGEPIKYCEVCNKNYFKKEKKKKEKEGEKQKNEELRKNKERDNQKKELLRNLQNDALVIKFSEKYTIYCLILHRNVPKNKYDCEEGYTYWNEGKTAFKNLLKLLKTQYSHIDEEILKNILKKKASVESYSDWNLLYNELKTKEKIYAHLLEHFKPIVEDDMSIGYRKYMKISLNCLQDKDITNANNLNELRGEIEAYQEKANLAHFERNLLSSSEETITIEDIDSMNGFEFEDFLSKLFTNMDYKVEQTKLSSDQGADLIIERNKNKTVVQAKCYSGKISNKAVQEVVASIKHYKADGGMIVTNSYFTPSAIKLADSNEIRLINRDKLKELIKKYFNSGDGDLEVKTKSMFNLDSNTMEIKCPKCEFDFNQTLDPNDENFEALCPECKSKIAVSLMGKIICPNCNKKFDTLKEIKTHLKLCKKH